MLVRSPVLRYLLAALVFASLLLLPFTTQRLFSFSFDTTFPIILAMVGCAWYLGRGPGLLIAVLLELTLLYFSAPAFTAKAVLITLNRLLLFTGVVWFASSRRAAETQLRDQKELLGVTLSSIGDAVIATDIDGRVTFLNPVAQSLTGWGNEDGLGRPLHEVFTLINEKSREPVANPFEKIKAEGNVVGLANHTVLISRDGREIPIEDSGAPIRESDGNLVGTVIVFHDVSEKRQVQIEREQLLAAERAARIEAEQANRLKDEFLAVVSHELRTPLNAILGWSSILRLTKNNGDELVDGLEIIERNARSQNRIISDILDVSRIASEKLVVQLQPVELVGVLDEVVESLRPSAEAKQISLETNLGESGLIVSGDAERLHQVFSNLVSNAIKFTPDGGRVRIDLQRSEREISVTITDNGIGIRPDFLNEIFDRFRQADSSIKRERGGLGLGLAIVRHLVELHKGKVHAASEGEGSGAVFTVTLPLLVSRTLTTTEGVPEAEAVDLSGVKVLLVDDDIDSLDVCCISLSRQGAETRRAASVAAAFEIMKEWRPDVLISDLGMPGEDGFDLVRRLRDSEASDGHHLPAAALTAYAGDDFIRQALNTGFDAHIAKPVDPSELAEAVKRLYFDKRASGS